IQDDEPETDLAYQEAPDTGEVVNGNGSDGTNGAAPGDGEPAEAPVEEEPVETEVAEPEPSEVPDPDLDPTANVGGPTADLPQTSSADELNGETANEEPIEEPAPTDVPVEPTAVP